MGLFQDPWVCYGGSHEDVLLNRVFKDIKQGFYVDIGAYHPLYYSNSKIFHDRGWQGINIEPGPHFEEFVNQRPGAINLKVVASNRSGQIHFFLNPDCPSLNTYVSNIAVEQPAILGKFDSKPQEATAKRLADIFTEHKVTAIDFISIDVEGAEEDVLRSNDWERFRPKVMVIEATAPLTNTLINEQWESYLTTVDYQRVFFDGVNCYYVDRRLTDFNRYAQLLSYPASPVDNFIHYDTVLLKTRGQQMEDIIAEQRQRLDDLYRKFGDDKSTIAELSQFRQAVLLDFIILNAVVPRSLQAGLWVARKMRQITNLFRRG